MPDLATLRLRLQTEGKLTLQIRVIPKSSKTDWVGELDGGIYMVKIAAAPEKGKAIEELIRFLAAQFGVRRPQVEIVAGATSQNKLVRINA